MALCTAALPAKESTGAILLMLMTGDLLAVWSYRGDADFRMLRRLVPAVLAGVGAGACSCTWPPTTPPAASSAPSC